jgi:hypothetical protein
MVGHFKGIAEKRGDSVAHKFIHRSAVVEDDPAMVSR